MKKYLLYIAVLFIFISGNKKNSFAGQMPQFSQYMLNNYYYNPAIAGIYKRYILKLSHRIQWVGMPGAPQTSAISMYGPSKDFNMGYGGYIYIDNTGPTSRKGLMGSYAYNIPVLDGYRLSFGLSVGAMQYYFDATQIDLAIAEPLYQNKAYSKLVPDATVGVYLGTYNMYAGFASHQLLGNTINLFEQDNAENRLVRHYYLIGGYMLDLNRDWRVEPYAILQGNFPEKLQTEISTQFVYRNMIWAGLSVRTSDKISSFTIIGKYKHERKYEFGLSYDIKNLSKYSMLGQGSIEVVLGYWFDEL